MPSTRLSRTPSRRALSGTVSRASKLGLRHPEKPAHWSDNELARALELAETGIPYETITKQLACEGYPRRTTRGFGPKIRAAGYGRGWGKAWLREEDALLKKAYETGSSLTQLRRRLGNTKCSIRWRAGQLGLSGTHKNSNGFRCGPDWSENDLKTLRTHYGAMPNAKLAKLLGRTTSAISDRANILGLVHGYIRAWSEEELQALTIAHENGISLADLAAALERKAMSVSKFATKRGLHFGRRPRSERTPTLKDILQLEKGRGR